MKKEFVLLGIAILLNSAILTQVTLNCPRGGTVNTIFAGANGECVTTAPTKGNVRYAIGSNCANATNDPIFIQGVCGCCPIFNNDCIKYTNSNLTATSDVFVIGGITYNVNIIGTVLNCAPGGSVTFLFTGANGACVTTAPTKGNVRYAIGSNCATATNDAIFIQGVCGCCPIFNNDCLKYTNTNTSATSDFLVIGGQSYLINIMSTLPVTLAGVRAYQENTTVHVEWTTQQESNMDKYDVERSQNGQQFVKIGTVLPNNSCDIACNYALIDGNPFRGTNFYRIKMIDHSGEITYSRVMKVNTGPGAPEVIVVPNPIIGNSIMVQLNNLPGGKYTISLFSNVGQEVLTQVTRHNGGSATQTIALPANLASGVYRLRVAGEGIDMVKMVVK